MPYKDPIEAKAYRRQYYLKHKSRILRQVTRYYYDNWDVSRQQREQWIRANPDKVRLAKIKYAQSPKGKLALAKATKRWEKHNVFKTRAHRAVRTAVSNGTLIKPSKCKRCIQTKPLEAHHFQGYKPINHLKVRWLCHKCHVIEEKHIS